MYIVKDFVLELISHIFESFSVSLAHWILEQQENCPIPIQHFPQLSCWPTIGGVQRYIRGCASVRGQLYRRTSVGCSNLGEIWLKTLGSKGSVNATKKTWRSTPLGWPPGCSPPVPPHVCSCAAVCAGWKPPAWKTRSDIARTCARLHLNSTWRDITWEHVRISSSIRGNFEALWLIRSFVNSAGSSAQSSGVNATKLTSLLIAASCWRDIMMRS